MAEGKEGESHERSVGCNSTRGVQIAQGYPKEVRFEKKAIQSKG